VPFLVTARVDLLDDGSTHSVDKGRNEWCAIADVSRFPHAMSYRCQTWAKKRVALSVPVTQFGSADVVRPKLRGSMSTADPDSSGQQGVG